MSKTIKTKPTSRTRNLEPLGYPPDWVNSFTFCKAICVFWNSTFSFQQSNVYQEYQTRHLSNSELLVSNKNKNSFTSFTVTIDQQPITQAAMQKALSNKQAAIQKILDNRFEQLMSKINTRLARMPRGKTSKPKPPKTPSKPSAIASSRWNPANLGYFNLHLDKSYPKGDIIAINKETWIYNVHLFMAWIKDLI